MARTPMGGTPGDVVVQVDPVTGDLELAAGTKKYDCYTAYTGGTLVTDIATPAGTGITYLSVGAGIDSNTGIADFLSKDGDQIDYYLQDQDHPSWARMLIRPKNLTSMVAGSGVSSIKLGSGGTPMTGAVEIDLSNLVTLGVATDSDLDTLASTVSGHTTTLGTHTTALAADAAAIDALPTLLEVQAAIAAAVDGIGGNTLLYLDWDPGTSTYPNRSTSGTSDPTRRVAYMDGPGPVKSGSGSTGAVAGDLHVGVS